MCPVVFPDTSTLRSFASIDQLTLLKSWLSGRGRCGSAVDLEVRRSVRYEHRMQYVLDEALLGEPIEATEVEEKEISGVRIRVFGGKPDEPTRHLGEAETFVLITSRGELRQALWLTDDLDARAYAQAQRIATLTSVGVLQSMCRAGQLQPARAVELVEGLRQRQRYVPDEVSEASFSV